MYWRENFDLQLFSDEKREPATPRRRQLAREQGQVFSSQELSGAASFIAVVFLMRIAFGRIAELLASRSVLIWSTVPSQNQETVEWSLTALRDAIGLYALAAVPIMLVASFVGVGLTVAQVGFAFRPNLALPKFERLNPIAGISRLFSRRTLEAFLRSLLKVLVMGFVVYRTLQRSWADITSLCIRDLRASLGVIFTTIDKLLVNCGMLILVIGLLDFVYQWWEYERSLMMSPREIREEIKESEVKPEVRSAIRARQRQMARRRMMQDVPKADVVVSNPTHFAVALKYEIDKDPAPKVLAKGADEVALKIKEIAKASGVQIVEDPPLARALFQAVDVGELIPEELYQAVAEVLAYVYRVTGRGGTQGV